MGSRIDTDLVLNALRMALWRRQPKDTVLVHSDQGCQFTQRTESEQECCRAPDSGCPSHAQIEMNPRVVGQEFEFQARSLCPFKERPRFAMSKPPRPVIEN